MIRTPQEFVNEVRARFSERLNDEIDEHGRTVMHFAEENNRIRAERDRLRDALTEVCCRVSVALNCPRHEKEEIDLLVHDLLGIEECARAAIKENEE